MTKEPRSLEDHKAHILSRFLADHWSINRIAKEIGFSRQGVTMALQSWGYETSKASMGKVDVECLREGCGRTRRMYRSEVRDKREKGERIFCSLECARLWMRQQFS